MKFLMLTVDGVEEDSRLDPLFSTSQVLFRYLLYSISSMDVSTIAETTVVLLEVKPNHYQMVDTKIKFKALSMQHHHHRHSFVTD